MSRLFSWLGGSSSDASSNEIKCLFPLALAADDFVKSDILSTYARILTDTMDRTHGLKEDLEPLLWDSCVQSDATHGLISLLAEAMTSMSELFIVYAPSAKVVRKATQLEQDKIRADYKTKGESSTGVFISFKHYRRTEMLRIYSTFEHCVLASLNKNLNVAKALQVKINDLRPSTSLADSSVAINQAKSIAEALRKGQDVLLDGKDVIDSASPNTEPTEKAMTFLDNKKAFILSLPLAYIKGEQTGGMNSTGEADMRAVERGLKQYYESILRPTLKALFGADTEFRTQDFREVTAALEVVKTFDLVSNENISPEAKQEITSRVFGLDPDKEKRPNKSAGRRRSQKEKDG